MEGTENNKYAALSKKYNGYLIFYVELLPAF
jgi:hypothetical protein